MAASTRTLLAAIGALTLCLSACSEDTTKNKSDAGADADGDADGSGDADGNGDGDADADADGSGDNDGEGDADGDGAPLEAGIAGKECSDNSACGTGTCTTSLTFGAVGGFLNLDAPVAGGYCTSSCMADADCGEGGTCLGAVDLLGVIQEPGECRKACTESSDCGREGFECAKTNPAFTENLPADVPDFLQGAISGLLPDSCQPAPTPDNLGDKVGKACTADADCGEGSCLGLETDGGAGPGGDFGFGDLGAAPGGYCTGACGKNEDCGPNNSGVCIGQFYGSAGFCLARCDESTPCARAAEGYTCQAIGEVSACVAEQQQTDDAGTPDPDAGTPAGDGGV